MGIHVIQHNTNDTTTGDNPGYMPSGLALSTDVHHLNNRKAAQSSYYEKHGHGALMHAEGAR